MGRFEEILTDEIYNNNKSISELKTEFEKDIKKIRKEIKNLYRRVMG